MPQYSFTSQFAPGDMVVIKVDEARRNHKKSKDVPLEQSPADPKLKLTGGASWWMECRTSDTPKIYQVLAVRFQMESVGANQNLYLLGGASGTDDLSALECEIELYKKED